MPIPIANEGNASVKKKIDLPKMPWTVRVPMLELYALAVHCVGCAVCLTGPLTAKVEGFLIFLALIFFWFGRGLQRGREDMAELLVGWVVICGILGGVLSLCILCPSQDMIAGCLALALSLPVLLLCLPSAKQWFTAVGAMRATKKPLSGCLGAAARILAWAVSVPVAFVVLIALLEIPGLNKASCLVKYENKEALILNEAEQVTKTFNFTQGGSNYTAIVLKPIGALSSGPAVLVADATGQIIDRCRDYGDNMRFRERWAFSWKDFRNEDGEGEAR